MSVTWTIWHWSLLGKKQYYLNLSKKDPTIMRLRIDVYVCMLLLHIAKNRKDEMTKTTTSNLTSVDITDFQIIRYIITTTEVIT